MIEEIINDEFDEILQLSVATEMPESFKMICSVEEALIKKYEQSQKDLRVMKIDHYTGIVLSENLVCITSFNTEKSTGQLCLAPMIPDYMELAVTLSIDDGLMPKLSHVLPACHTEFSEALEIIKERINHTA